MGQLIADGRLVSPVRVFKEIQRKESGLHAWLRERPLMFLPLSRDVQDRTKIILAQFPKMVDDRPGKFYADPFVIATAQFTGAAVVTSEKPTRTPKRPKIPDVCDHFRLPCLDLVGMISEEGWVF